MAPRFQKPPEGPAPIQVHDAAAAIHRDNAGAPRTKEITEGAANFASVAEQARLTIEVNRADEIAAALDAAITEIQPETP